MSPGHDSKPDTAVAASRPLRAWQDLNDRQRVYLDAAYREDARAESFERSAYSRGLSSLPASEWRWLSYGSHLVDDTQLRASLKARGLVDAGSGSTWSALERRGLLQTRCSFVRTPLGPAKILMVRLSSKGRAAARAGLGESVPERLPPGTLRQWHWRALLLAHAAGAAGLEHEGGDRYAGVGWKTWRRLLDYRSSRGGYGGLVEDIGERLYITPDGRRFYEERRKEYHRHYPGLDPTAPDTTTTS